MAQNRKRIKIKNAKPVASKKKGNFKAIRPKMKAKARPARSIAVRKLRTPLKAARKAGKAAIRKKAVVSVKRMKKPSVPGMKKTGITVVSTTRQVSPEQKAEMEHIHRILSDAYVRQMLIEVGGENALEIVRHFYGSHSDEELAKSLSLRISDVRATLNRLHSKGLVQYAREKDSETGWYSYSWSLNKERIVKWVTETTGKGIAASSADGNQYYFCPACGLGSIVDFSQATDHEFRCNKCNKSLEFIEEERFSTINQCLRK